MFKGLGFTGLGRKALRAVDPETAHRWAIRALAAGHRMRMAGQMRGIEDPVLGVTLWDRRFVHPIGVAAGFDKNAEAPDALLAIGASFVEVGAVTPLPQAGNSPPRLFRLQEDRAAINRMGFNNEGLEAIAARLKARSPSWFSFRRDRKPIAFIGANLGANKDALDRMADYEAVLRQLWGLVGFFSVNVSSPNTERLRELQGRGALSELLRRVIAARDELAHTKTKRPVPFTPVLLKVSPDLSPAEIEDIAAVALEVGLDGIVATNTTLDRPSSLQSEHRAEAGGLSGAPLFEKSTEVLRQFRRATGGRVPLIGVGGVSTADDAYAKIRAGASLVQLYTALAFRGPRLFGELRMGLARRLRRDGFKSVEQAVGVDVDA